MYSDRLEDIVRGHVLTVLERNQGNRTHSHRALGISLKGLRNLLVRYKYEGYRITEPTMGIKREVRHDQLPESNG